MTISAPAPIGPDEYRAILSRFASGVTVVTARRGEQLSGMTVSAFCSVSLRPPLVLVSLTTGRPTTELIAETGWYAVNVLSEDQAPVSEHFAFTEPAARFDDVPWSPGPHGTPLLKGTIGSLECRVDDIHQAGDHQIIVGEVMFASMSPGLPVVYTQRRYHTLGDVIDL